MSMTPTNVVDDLLAEAFRHEGLPSEHAFCVPSGRPEWGDLQCNAIMQVARDRGVPPRPLATRIAARLTRSPAIAKVEVAGPGFVNVTLSDEWVRDALISASSDPTSGVAASVDPQRVLIDFGGPNVAKALHVGHLRSLVIGESIRRILIALGHSVISDIHLGDWGLQMGMLVSEIRLRWPDLPCLSLGSTDVEPFLDVATLGDLYRAASSACKEDPGRRELARADTLALQEGDPGILALWSYVRRISLDHAMADVGRLGARFDLLLGESDSHDRIAPMIQDLVARGLAVESEGAIVAPTGMDGPPLLLRKSDGAALYGTTDLAALRERVEGGAGRIVYVVDERQTGHLSAVFAVARLAGYAPDEVSLEHAGFGTVNGKDGKPLKTREGSAVELSSLLDDACSKALERLGESDVVEERRESVATEVGIGALKFADLSSPRSGSYVFDPDRFLALEGRTGPYLQYAVARISSIVAKAHEAGVGAGAIVLPTVQERDLAMAILSYPDAVVRAGRDLAPHLVAEATYIVAKAFSRFYAHCPVAGAETPDLAASRVAICEAASRTLVHGLGLLGIAVPQRI